jgi:hypothetical protein
MKVNSNIIFKDNEIYLQKPELAPEDEVAIAFASILEKLGVKYAVVSGYVAILFGMARGSEDIDFIAELSKEEFEEICNIKGFELLQGPCGEAWEILEEGHSVRLLHKNKIFPNVELKLPKTEVHKFVIENAIKVVINDSHVVRISPLELQIAYKLYLGSDKDLGDAAFLFELFRNALDLEELERWCKWMNCSLKGLGIGRT